MGSILCFRRDYSPEHLVQHPKQTTKSVLLAFQEQGLVTIVLSQRTGALNRILAGCGWREGARIDTSDRKMIPISTSRRDSGRSVTVVFEPPTNRAVLRRVKGGLGWQR